MRPALTTLRDSRTVVLFFGLGPASKIAFGELRFQRAPGFARETGRLSLGARIPRL
jgi:hypothetical protein